MAIGVAVADSITGPYVDKGEPIVTGPRFTTIDPYIFKDDDGKRYMYWGSGHEPLKVQELSNDGMSLVDRKSTRLNSSHVKISYAVFCLKKKRKKEIPR